MNKLQINPPTGYEIDQEKSDLTAGIIHFKEVEKKLTYEDITMALFSGKKVYYTDEKGEVNTSYEIVWNRFSDPNNSTSGEQLESLMALNKLCNVAKYLNGDWLPDSADIDKNKLYIYIHSSGLDISSHNCASEGNVFFKSRELALQAIEILGKETILKALTLNH